MKICSTKRQTLPFNRSAGNPTGFFTPRRTLIGAVMTVMGRLDEEHWDIDQVLEGWEPRDAGAALNDAGDDL